MTESKKSYRKPTRHQPKRVASTGKTDEAEAGDITTSHSSVGVRKPKGKSRRPTARQRKKFQEALVKRVDAQSSEAWDEQARLLGLSDTSPPASPASTTPPKPQGQGRHKAKGKKYMDDILDPEDNIEDELKRGNRWIPNFEQRKRPNVQPPGIPYSLWMSYKHLDDYIYRHSLSPAELEALPMLEDVHEYQNSDGRTPKPITPRGYQWDEHLELIPVER
ncbi:hypothetical protein E0Z10_g5979 [Xylaria hypoxylon]|uniref:Uncharacterized protein n=1 Tax=Xylaria hypoxylon TaxID=37992 RepID=A0A4Z0YZN9_9PEZI|nr:hypothetical protein E0Z10_g5979 [Xylaria hypoxylon]